MYVECDKCSEKTLHWHCRYCGHTLTQRVTNCPACGIPDPTNESTYRIAKKGMLSCDE